jgi:hypothetical protein
MGRRKRRAAASGATKSRPFRRAKGPLSFYRLVPARLGPRALMSPMRQLESRAFARAAGGNPIFSNLFLTVAGLRALRRSFKRKPEVLILDKLEPGQGLRVRTAKPPKRGMGPRDRQRGLPA